MHSRIKKIIFVFCLLIPFSDILSAKIIHKERSTYRNVVITEKKNTRCMSFESRKKSISNQACINLKNKEKLVFEYARSVLVGLAYNPKPERILIIGLGGGSLPKAFSALLPETEVISVEIDPAVAKLARKYFDYSESDKIKTSVMDGRVYVKRALKKQQHFDWIILDAFNGDYIPEHLLTIEFLTEVKNLLKLGGLLSANTFNGSKLFDYESVTYQKVFTELRILKSPTKGNRVIFACNCDKIDQKLQWDEQLATRLAPHGTDLRMLISRLSDEVNWDTSVQPLTDQFSPANLLIQ